VSALAYRHQRAQRLRRLLGRRRARQEEGRFVVEGANLLDEVLGSGVPVEAVFVDGGCTQGSGVFFEQRARVASLVERCYDLGARVFELEPGVLDRIAGTVSPQPIMAIVETPVCTLEALGHRCPRLLVVCVDVRDPGNAGTVARSAWAAGADGIVCCEGTVDLWNPKAVRASAGAVLHVPVVAAGPAASTLDDLGAWGLVRWGTVAEGGEDYATTDLARPCALVLGNEAAGLAVEELGDRLDGLVSIPMAAGAESINVGMAAAVLCFEAARQRRLGAATPGSTPGATSMGSHDRAGAGKLAGP